MRLVTHLLCIEASYVACVCVRDVFFILTIFIVTHAEQVLSHW